MAESFDPEGLAAIAERYQDYIEDHSHPSAFACCSAHASADDVQALLEMVNRMRQPLEEVRRKLEAYEAWARQAPVSQFHGVVRDGYGGSWVRCKTDCQLRVVRPGKVQCPCDEDGADG